MSKLDKFLEFARIVRNDKKYCASAMAEHLGVTMRTVGRYRAEFEKLFGIKFERYGQGCYYIKEGDMLKEALSDIKKESKELELLFDFLAMVNPKLFEVMGYDKEIVEKITADFNGVYQLKEFPFEELMNCSILNDLKKAIKYNQYVDLVYAPYGRFEYKNVKPIKIVYAEGNWYLAALTPDEINDGFKFLRINFIEELQIQKRQFRKDYEALRFVKEFQSLFSAYRGLERRVVVEVDEEVARYFRYKKFLPSQRILEDSGKLQLEYRITNDEEILFLAKRWMPHMRIVSPDYLHERLEKIAKRLLEYNASKEEK